MVYFINYYRNGNKVLTVLVILFRIFIGKHELYMAYQKRDNLTNPFIEDLRVNIKTKKSARLISRGDPIETINMYTGEVSQGMYSAILKDKVIEKDKFVKIYPEGCQVFNTLSKNATSVLWYFISVVGYGDTVALNMKKVKEFTGYNTDKSIYTAISELKDKNIIANHYRNGIYYINPVYFYKGYRIKLLE